MSLAMFAAPFDTEPNNSNSDIINKKRLQHNKTQKMYAKETFVPNSNANSNSGSNNSGSTTNSKVNSVLQQIHNNDGGDSDEEKDNFIPLSPPESSGVNKTKQLPSPQRENMTNYLPSNDVSIKTLGRTPSPVYDNNSTDLDLNNYNNYGNEQTNNQYYTRVIPNYTNTNMNTVNKPYYNTNVADVYPTQDLLLQKLNYMITLLEDQQDERTNNVTEEVVLYSFLGIFIIFIADTFVRTGKYVR